MPRGSHKNSLSNLTHEGRPLEYGEPKKERRLSVTATGWNQAKLLIEEMGMSVSRFVEELGRGRVTVIRTEELEAIVDVVESVLLRQAIAGANGEFMDVDAVLAERELTQADLDG
jgi:hypothetical protein